MKAIQTYAEKQTSFEKLIKLGKTIGRKKWKLGEKIPSIFYWKIFYNIYVYLYIGLWYTIINLLMFVCNIKKLGIRQAFRWRPSCTYAERRFYAFLSAKYY